MAPATSISQVATYVQLTRRQLQASPKSPPTCNSHGASYKHLPSRHLRATHKAPATSISQVATYVQLTRRQLQASPKSPPTCNSHGASYKHLTSRHLRATHKAPSTSLEHTGYKQLYRRPAYKPRAHQLQAYRLYSLQASSTPASSNSTGVKPTSPEHTHRPTQPYARATIYKPLPRFKPALLRTLQATPRYGRGIHTCNEEARPADLGTPRMPLAPQLAAPPPLPGASAQTSSGKQSARVPADISR
ncbi:uncharacterized protein LOC126989635 [Eriocheir sinensis]|uniref:uncharacterized protein LOC126989635 n=1 Tax=Eriocheir sinensis TaxID=95602 RepID=UPI0021C966DB|nr:uncharacterized protein LOC126989635 [Eriocheir sinensis]